MAQRAGEGHFRLHLSRRAGEVAQRAGEGHAVTPYRGRFAPSPTGRLHFGSLVAAVGSYLDAQAHDGEWLVRIEDLDPPRTRPGAADQILTDLDAYGFEWDGPVTRQSDRFHAYGEIVQRLERAGALRACSCSRSALSRLPENLARSGGTGDELFHPLACLEASAALGRSLRLSVPDGPVTFTDRSLGLQSIDVAATVGDFVLQRRDGLFAYQLAVVVDDAFQGVTDVVRGCDLLASTARQVLLQRALGLAPLRYLHLPLAVDERGLKLSKSGGAAAADGSTCERASRLVSVLEFLGQMPPPALLHASLDEVWEWGRQHWRIEGFAGCAARAAPQVAC